MRKSKVQVDLNLFEIIMLMVEMKSLKLVGLKMGKSESAISKALSKASEQLNRTLFVRGSNGLEPTHYTRKIYPDIKSALQQMHFALDIEPFDPNKYQRPIHIAMLAQPMHKYGLQLLTLLNQTFPIATIEISTWQSNTADRILNNDIDLALYALNDRFPSNLYQQGLINDKLIWAVAKKHQYTPWHELLNWPVVLTRTAGWNDHGFKMFEQMNLFSGQFKSIIVDDVNIAVELAKTGKFILPTSKASMVDDFSACQMPEEHQIPIKLVTCMRLQDRDAPLQILLTKLIKSLL